MILGSIPALQWAAVLHHAVASAYKGIYPGATKEDFDAAMTAALSIEIVEICILEALSHQMRWKDSSKMSQYVGMRFRDFFGKLLGPEILEDDRFELFFDDFYSDQIDWIVLDLSENVEALTGGWPLPLDTFLTFKNGSFILEVEDPRLSKRRPRPTERPRVPKAITTLKVNVRPRETLSSSTKRVIKLWEEDMRIQRAQGKIPGEEEGDDNV